MKIYLAPPQPSLGLERIRTALTRYAPDDIEIVDDVDDEEADLFVFYAIGRRDSLERQTREILRAGKRYAVIQVCLRSTMRPYVRHWEWLWADAECVWSYYDLEQAVRDDYEGYNPGSDFQVGQFREHVNFYHAPLGADSEVFKVDGQEEERTFTIATSGESRLSESVRECWLAAEAVDGNVVHLGPLKRDGVLSVNSISDAAWADRLVQCQFVSGLRRKEGFELPAVEGLLCGARPIVFNTPDFHWNYGDHAEYIEEGTRQEVVDQLVELFKRGARPVTAEERAAAVERFNWETIIKGFYERLH